MLHSFRKSTNIFFSNDNLIIFLLAKLKFYSPQRTQRHTGSLKISSVLLCVLCGEINNHYASSIISKNSSSFIIGMFKA